MDHGQKKYDFDPMTMSLKIKMYFLTIAIIFMLIDKKLHSIRKCRLCKQKIIALGNVNQESGK